MSKIEALVDAFAQPYRILIVDDIENNRFTLDTMLSVLGEFEIEEAEDGAEALEKIAEGAFDLVLLDIMMPGMTGLDVLDRLEANSRSDLPEIIVVSALTDIETVAQALEKGALDYLHKPIEQPLLEARLTQLLERKHATLTLRKQQTRLDADLRKAAIIQQSICPSAALSLSSSAGGASVEAAGGMHTTFEVGGDFFDYFSLPDGSLFFTVGDACDKGASAAMYATRTRDLVRLSAASRFSEGVDRARFLANVVTDVNSILSHENEECWFVTLWAGMLCLDTRELHYCSAGHCEALVGADGSFAPLPVEPAPPLGLDPDTAPAVAMRQIGAHETVLVFSDGVLEVADATGAFIGVEGLQKLWSETPAPNAARVTQVLDQLRGLGGDTPPHDDLTLLSVQLQG